MVVRVTLVVLVGLVVLVVWVVLVLGSLLVLLLESVLLRPEALGCLLVHVYNLVRAWVLEVVGWLSRAELFHFDGCG